MRFYVLAAMALTFSAGCDPKIIPIDTAETGDSTVYDGARIRQPDAGWRTYIRETPAAPVALAAPEALR